MRGLQPAVLNKGLPDFLQMLQLRPPGLPANVYRSDGRSYLLRFTSLISVFKFWFLGDTPDPGFPRGDHGDRY